MFEKFRFCSKISKISISVKNFDFGPKFRKSRFRSKISIQNLENLDFDQNFRKISISVQISKHFDFGQKF